MSILFLGLFLYLQTMSTYTARQYYRWEFLTFQVLFILVGIGSGIVGCGKLGVCDSGSYK